MHRRCGAILRPHPLEGWRGGGAPRRAPRQSPSPQRSAGPPCGPCRKSLSRPLRAEGDTARLQGSTQTAFLVFVVF
eukprot:7994763-Pyramimonas_sp.AAC.1